MKKKILTIMIKKIKMRVIKTLKNFQVKKLIIN